MSIHSSASGENSTVSFASPTSNKKKRSLPGNPDPEAEVIALSPRSLLATNRFVCEICGKGFQRDQNLQLHRRGHNLPWKLKQNSSKDVKKKVYVCPEETCVHHDPCRALGDLTGIKKHFSRKHGDKKWKCDKCSKRYAVQSDWKAHSKTCGTRDYRCDCGTIFSRRDSFITHRAFCDALADESVRVSPLINAGNPTVAFPSHAASTSSHGPQPTPWHRHQDQPIKIEQQQHARQQQLPTSANHMELPPPLFPSAVEQSPYMSATALLQRAAQMGAAISRAPQTQMMGLFGCPQQGQLPPPTPLIHEMGIDGPLDEALGAMFGSKRGVPNVISSDRSSCDAWTKDFLGPRHVTQRDKLGIAELSSCMSNSYEETQPSKEPWSG